MSARHNTIDEAKLEKLIAQGLKYHVIAQRLRVTQGAIFHARKRLEERRQRAAGVNP